MASAKSRAFDPVLAAILFAALLLRLGYLAFTGLPDRGPLHGFVIDEQEYYGAAAVLADGRGLQFYDTFTWTRTPAYPLLVGALFAVAGRTTGPVFVLQALLAVLTLYGLAWLAGRAAARAPGLGLSPRTAMRAAAVLGALWLPFTLFANLLLSETLFLVFVVAAFIALARYADSAAPRPVGPAVAAGLLLGLAALTRSTALAFVPLAALWVALLARGRGVPVRWWAAPVGLLLGATVLLAPQVAQNYTAYHRAILGDTSSGYNLWLAANGVKDAERLAGDLAAIPNPGDKQSYAVAKAWEIIAARPWDFAAKGLKESLDLWRINFSSEERQVRGYALGRVPAVHLWSLLVGEDLLYIIIVLAGLLGLAVAPPDPLKALLGLWALLWTVTAFVFFAVTRFRFPVVALLVPWAPLGMAYLGGLLRRRPAGQDVGARRVARGQAAALGLLAVLFAVVVAPRLGDSWSATTLGAAKWDAQAPLRAAVPHIAAGDVAGAEALLALADATVPDTLYARDAVAIRGALTPAPDRAALAAIAARPEIALGPDSPLAARFEPFLLNGYIQQQLGNTAALTVFNARSLRVAGPEAVTWAARSLPPPTTNRLDIGSDLDFGAVDGFYPSEHLGPEAGALTYRWSGPHGAMRFHPAQPGQQLVIHWSGARPTGVPAARVTLRSGGAAQTVALPP
ncbi:MAG TPA: hypothetical protein VM536_12905, partial [Chloroflexia bacterium]|nr:hypothetical protein [Chloroflexia bacterium]